VSQTREKHEQVADLLAQLGRLRVELRLIVAPDDCFEMIVIDFTAGEQAVRNRESKREWLQIYTNRWNDAKDDLVRRRTLYDDGKLSLDELQEAKRRQAATEQSYWAAVVALNQALAESPPAPFGRLKPAQVEALLKGAGTQRSGRQTLFFVPGRDSADAGLTLAAQSTAEVAVKIAAVRVTNEDNVALRLAIGDGPRSELRMFGYQTAAGESLLFDATPHVPAEGVPLLNKIPHLDRLFKNVGAPADSRVLLLVTPRLPAAPANDDATRATSAAKQ
jgi:hypothetical protein